MKTRPLGWANGIEGGALCLCRFEQHQIQAKSVEISRSQILSKGPEIRPVKVMSPPQTPKERPIHLQVQVLSKCSTYK